ncbi:hypothetical protein ABIA39_008637 [Nocardia sp. GAS34]|uniref:hypothetical protein n=1 Tax=unclassified Nocardia TaxID=2637762 RepID=UPI003D1B7F34
MVSEFDSNFSRFRDCQLAPWGRLRYEQAIHNLSPHLPDHKLQVLDAGAATAWTNLEISCLGDI